MRSRIAAGLVMTLALGALMAAPASGEPGKGAHVVRGGQADANNDCAGAMAAIEALDTVEAVATYTWRWVYKSNGRPSKLFCHIKGATIDDSIVDPPGRPRGNVLRLRDQAALDARICPGEPHVSRHVGELLRGRLKLNAKGNGFLKCVYAPSSA